MKVFTEDQNFNQSIVYIGISISLIAVIFSTLNEWKKILIGTQKKAALERVLNTYKHKFLHNEI
ncbi:hypothetical protein BX611_0204 [Lutibacter oceani]|uniref:Uncharacterized protein n=1 Tax=Lutibacter oceani TaxID=1853311 RepID=A0A3D9RTY3_9FLAO|nr:hypothetical protein [Lutibacter oceani]REE82928.1 hypothetical protein BX611_0204 [Lutibacter oceani]